MKKFIVPLFAASVVSFSCTKEEYSQTGVCIAQTANPAGTSYTDAQLINTSYYGKQCGLIPLSSKNYWIYEDSVFQDGQFIKVQYDTLRYTASLKSVSDNLLWWKSNIYVGLPETMYVTDSAFYEMSNRLFSTGIKDVKKDYSLFAGDSVKYLASFDDNAALGKSFKLNGDLKTPAGSFSNCIFFEKNAYTYRRDQMHFKPGVGVIKYKHEKSPMGSRTIKLQQIMTLVAYHIE